MAKKLLASRTIRKGARLFGIPTVDAYFRVYKDKAKEWRWTYIAGNGNKLADSSEGYKNRGDCLKSLEYLRFYAAASEVKVPTPPKRAKKK